MEFIKKQMSFDVSYGGNLSNIDVSKEFKVIETEEKFKVAGTLKKIKELQVYAESSKEKERLQKAINLMVKLHIDQKDRPQEPYLNHTSNVPLRLINEYGIIDNDLIIAAMLHDSVEDQALKLAEISSIKKEISDREKSLEYISKNFGPRVAKIVADLSNPESSVGVTPYEKNKIYQEHVKEIIKDPDVALIKLSDFSENALRLDEVADNARRLKLTQKYLGAVQIFIDRLEDPIIPEHKHLQIPINMPDDRRYSLIKKLEEVYEDMKEFMDENLPPKQITQEEIYLNEIERLDLPNGASWDEIKEASRAKIFKQMHSSPEEKEEETLKQRKKIENRYKEQAEKLGFLNYENATWEEQQKVKFFIYRIKKIDGLKLSETTWKEIMKWDIRADNVRSFFIKLTEYLNLPETASWDKVEKELRKRSFV